MPTCTQPDQHFAELRRTGDRTLRAAIVCDYDGAGQALCWAFRRRGEPHDDLVQVSYVGLVKAVDTDPHGPGPREALGAGDPATAGEGRGHAGLDDFVTHGLPLADAAEAYALLQAKRDGAIKLVLSPEPGPAAQPDG